MHATPVSEPGAACRCPEVSRSGAGPTSHGANKIFPGPPPLPMGEGAGGGCATTVSGPYNPAPIIGTTMSPAT